MTGASADTLNKPGNAAPARTMRALTLVADRKIELLDIPAPPEPGPGEVQIAH